MMFSDTGRLLLFAHGAVPSAAFWFYLLFVAVVIGVLRAIIGRGIAKRRRWSWWLTSAATISIVFFVVSTYQFEIHNAVVVPLIDWLGF